MVAPDGLGPGVKGNRKPKTSAKMCQEPRSSRLRRWHRRTQKKRFLFIHNGPKHGTKIQLIPTASSINTLHLWGWTSYGRFPDWQKSHRSLWASGLHSSGPGATARASAPTSATVENPSCGRAAKSRLRGAGRFGFSLSFSPSPTEFVLTAVTNGAEPMKKPSDHVGTIITYRLSLWTKPFSKRLC